MIILRQKQYINFQNIGNSMLNGVTKFQSGVNNLYNNTGKTLMNGLSNGVNKLDNLMYKKAGGGRFDLRKENTIVDKFDNFRSSNTGKMIDNTSVRGIMDSSIGIDSPQNSFNNVLGNFVY